MWRLSSVIVLLFLSCTACSPRAGYEMMQQVEYQKCLRESPHPAEDCRFGPDYDNYRLQRQERLSEDGTAD